MRLKRRIIVFSTIVLILLIGFKGCEYLNLLVSEKYETQIDGITKDPEALHRAKERSVEIQNQKKQVIIVSIVSLAAVIVLIATHARIEARPSK